MKIHNCFMRMVIVTVCEVHLCVTYLNSLKTRRIKDGDLCTFEWQCREWHIFFMTVHMYTYVHSTRLMFHRFLSPWIRG